MSTALTLPSNLPILPEQGQGVGDQFASYRKRGDCSPLFLCGDALKVLQELPSGAVNCVMTSPPYWGKREYDGGGIGLEYEYAEYVSSLAAIAKELFRVLAPDGSFWLNIGDSYLGKSLLGLPWRVSHKLTDEQGWILRNDIIWHKVKGGPDNSTDKVRNVHEHLFHFVRQARGYYYDDAAVRTPPKSAKVVNGAVVSATGVTGIRYQRQIELSSALTPAEKASAMAALQEILREMVEGRLADFRMVIRKQQRTTHSDSSKVSGRAKELEQRGFYFLKYHPDGSKIGDVWDILPEDTQKRGGHFAPYPEDLCKIPILASSRPGDIILDPFVGTGTTCLVAMRHRRRSVGIDISPNYIRAAEDRCRALF